MDQDGDILDQCVIGLSGINLFLHEQAKIRLAASWEREIRLQRGLRSLQRLQEMRPLDGELEEQMAIARQEIREVEESRHDFFFHMQAAQWSQVGDRVIGEFLSWLGRGTAVLGYSSSRSQTVRWQWSLRRYRRWPQISTGIF